MSDSQEHDPSRTPLLEKSHVPRLPLALPSLSRTWITIMAIAVQAIFCGLIWSFVGAMIVNKVIPLPDNWTRWIQKNPSETNMAITVMSTVLSTTGSLLLGMAVQHALTFRLPRGLHLSKATAWIQLARNALFLQPRRHLWWTLLSVLWVAVNNFLTAAWSNLLTPEIVVQNFTATKMDFDFLNYALYKDFASNFGTVYIDPAKRNFSLTPDSASMLLPDNSTEAGELRQAGRSAILASINPGVPGTIGPFNSSSGGIDLDNVLSIGPLVDVPTLQENYQGLSTSYTLVQQGFTANISCRVSSSPTIALNSTASAEYTFESPSGRSTYTSQTWSWSTNCSGNGQYYTGGVNIMANSNGLIGNGLFATSVCFYQDFSGPSNQSFLLLLQSPINSGYNGYYSVDNPNLPTVCQFTPMVTTLEVQYNESMIANVNKVLDRALLPEDAWPLLSGPALEVWAAYFLAQGPYSNSLADDLIQTVEMMDPSLFDGDYTPVLEKYLRGIFEYIGTSTRLAMIWLPAFNPDLPIPPDNMFVYSNGTMHVQTIGWRFHPRTHGVALAVITLVTIVTVASGMFALLDANGQKTIRNALQKGSASGFDPTNLMDVLVASSMGSLANALSQPQGEEDRDKLIVELHVTDGGQSLLNVHADVVVDDVVDDDVIEEGVVDDGVVDDDDA